MKDELHIYCRLERIDEVYLRACIEADKRLLKLEKRRRRSKEPSGRECRSLENSKEPSVG